MGRAVYPVWLAWKRLCRRTGRVTLVALGVATGAGALAAVLAGSLVGQDRSLARATARVPDAERTVRAVWGGIPGQTGTPWPKLDRQARPILRTLRLGEPFSATLFRESEIGGALVDLGGIEDLARWVRLESGRLPRSCRPERCEVVQIAGRGKLPRVPGLRLVRVGRARLVSALPIENFISRDTEGTILADSQRYHTPALPPFLLAEGVRGLADAPALADLYRGYDWVLPVRAGAVHPWTIDGFASAVSRVRSAFTSGSEFFDVVAPVEELQAANDSSRVAARRLLLIGGEAAALLLAFTVLAAASLRRDVEAAWRRLTWFGARRRQLVALSAAEWGAVAVVGTLAGWGLGALVGGIAADTAGSPAWAVIVHSLLSAGGLAVAAGLAVAVAVLLLAALRLRPLRVGALSISALDLAAVAALGAVVLAFARGRADAATLSAEGGTGAILILLPALIAFVAAVASARLLALVLRALERIGRRGPVAPRLAALSLSRNPGRATIAATFLVVSLGLGLFAATYRSTLERGQRDQAAYAVPTGVILTEDLSRLVYVLDAAPLSAYSRVGHALPVLRLDGAVPRLAGNTGFTLLGLPARAVPNVDGWRSDFSSAPLGDLAGRIEPRRPMAMEGVRLPRDARDLVLAARVDGTPLKLRGHVLTPRGEIDFVSFGRLRPGVTRALRARLPEDARGGLLFSLSLDLADTELHDVANAGLGAQQRARGVLTLGALRSGGRTVSVDWRRWLGVNGVTVVAGGRTARLRYLVSPELDTRFRARQPTDGRPVPVITTPDLAAAAGPGGTLPLAITGQQLVTRVVGTAKRFPSVYGDFVLADRQTVTSALNAEVPGSAFVSEVWIDPPYSRAALDRPPFAALTKTTRTALEADLRSDPLARGVLITLAAAAAVALALALAGVLLAVVSDRRDESGELFDLESQGAGPATLRRHLRLRTLVVALFGVLGGIATGAALSALVVDLVVLTANATAPEPPLLLSLDWRLLLVAGVAYCVAAAVLIVVATSRLEDAGRLREVTA